MSCNYADGLSPYHDKGQLGLEERFDSKSVVTAKVSLLTKWINEANHVVIHTGAGISTSAGIPDFRGPRGVWTLQAKGEKPDLSTDFNEAIPTITHMAITKLVEKGKVKYVVSQNIDGLHLRSNLPRKFLSELHGNMFIEQCNQCNRQFVRSSAVPTVGQKSLNKPCPTLKPNGRPCRGKLHDCILDWEHNLPENDLGMADYHSCMSDLSICLGTTMQIVPSGNLPLYTKKHGGKLVICNLQPTKHDRKADLLIHAYVDEIMTMLMKNLNLKIPKYTPKNDPTKTTQLTPDKFMEWTISDYTVKKMKKVYEEKCGTKEARKRLEMIDDDLPLSIAQNLKRKRSKDEDDSDLEVLDVIVKSKKGEKEPKKRGPKKKEPKEEKEPAMFNTTITVKKVSPPAPKKQKYEGEKITIKKNVTPTKTKYEIVQPKPKKSTKCEIVYCTDSDVCNDLDMICESDDDDNPPNFTYNFKLYLQDCKEVKKEEMNKEEEVKSEEDVKETKKEEKVDESSDENSQSTKNELNGDIKEEIKSESEASQDKPEEKKEEESDGEKISSEDKNESSDNAEKSSNEEIIEKQNVEETEKPNEESQNEKDIPDNEEKQEEVTETMTEKPKETEEKMDISESEPIQPEPSKEPEEEMYVSENETPRLESNQNESEKIPSEDIPPKEDDKSSNEQKEHNSLNEPSTVDNELDKLIKDAEIEKEATETTPEDKKSQNLYNNIESELSNLSNSNIENAIDQFDAPSDTPQFDNSLQIPDCNINNPISENYNFYNNEYNASSSQPDLDYVANNYYNTF